MTVVAPFRARLVQHRMLTPTVRELVFERCDGQPVSYEAGQWVNILMRLGGDELKRSYSIASAPNGTPTFELAVTLVENGPGSTHLHHLETGAEVDVHGPSGFFVRREPVPSLFVGTGTGLTPLRSMIKDALARGESVPMQLIAGVREEGDRLYVDELDALSERAPHFRAENTLSRPGPAWRGRSGYVQTHVRELYESLGARADGQPVHVYICGLQKMVTAVRDLLRKEMQLPRELVHSERYD